MKDGCEFHGEKALFEHMSHKYEDGKIEHRFRCRDCVEDYLMKLKNKENADGHKFFYRRHFDHPMNGDSRPMPD